MFYSIDFLVKREDFFCKALTVSRYDHSFGRSFESFAIPTIVGEMKRYIRDKTWSIHVPRRIKELGPKIKKAIEEKKHPNSYAQITT